MAKPICLIKIDTRNMGSGRIDLYETLKFVGEKMPDYHVFAVPFTDEDENEPVQMQVFYEKDFTDIQYEELKKLILDTIGEQK